MISVHPTELSRLFSQAGVGLAVLFGSAATGRDRPDSDVDIGIIPDASVAFGIDDELRLAVAVEEVLGREVDLVRLDQASTLLRFEVAHGRNLFQARPGLFADFVARALLEHEDLRPILRRCAAGMFNRLKAAHDQT